MYLEELSVDSGVVDIVVHDSLMANDSTIAWNIEQRQALWHLRFVEYHHLDTTYITLDALFFVGPLPCLVA